MLHIRAIRTWLTDARANWPGTYMAKYHDPVNLQAAWSRYRQAWIDGLMADYLATVNPTREGS